MLLPVLLAFAFITPVTHPAIEETERVAILVPVEVERSWRDDAFLAAVPGAARLGEGEPITLAVDASAPWRPELLRFLVRFEPTRILWVGEESPASPPASLPELELLPCTTAAEAAVSISGVAWSRARRVVLFDLDDRGAALSASALAARLGEPLFPCRKGVLEPAVLAALETLDTVRALYVGGGEAPKLPGMSVESIESGESVVRWLKAHRYPVEYLAAVNPRVEIAGQDRHLALAAPLLAAARSGAVAPLPFATRWKNRFDAPNELTEAPPGAALSSVGWRAGEIKLDEGTTAFLSGRDPTDTCWWLQLDRNGDGRFDGEGEQPIRTGESFTLGKRSWVADLDAQENAGGKFVWLTSPTTAEIREELDRYHTAAEGEARFLCLIGWPEALPMAVISHGQGIDADLVSDLPFAQTDPDPFVELAFARFVAEDLPSATLLACRGFARDDFPDQSWRGSFATAEWAGGGRAQFEAAGLRFTGHHVGEAPIAADSSLTTAELILHGSHAMWTVLGATYTWDSNVLLAPALVESSGCNTASLDQDGEYRSVATRMLRNGAVAFVGNTRRGIAQGNLFRSELWIALLGGATLGEAQRSAQNRVLVAVHERGETTGGLYFYQLYNHAVYGDPALQLDLARPKAERAARVTQRGKKVTVHAPKRWNRLEYVPNEEWGCPFPLLYTWSAAGVAVESSWYDPEKRNADVAYINVEARTQSPATSIEPIGKVPAPLGWTGSCFVDEHADGSRSLYWRVRMLDGDMTTGEVRVQVDSLQFRLIQE
ncbi:MAG: hypothetical protein ACI9F9_001126 [Candidatus Paceibacteria bacterium]|jgi:hypothetical protein